MSELQMILAALTALGETGKDAFIWWLVFDKLIPSSIFLVALLIGGYIVHQGIHSSILSTRLRDAMGIGRAGAISYEEETLMFRWIAQAKKYNELK